MKAVFPQPAMYAAPPPAAAAVPKFNIYTLLSALRCWWHIALPMGLVLAAAAAVVVFYITKPTYTAEVWLNIQARQRGILPGGMVDDSRKFVANQIELMRSPPVLDPVITIRDVRMAPELRDEDDPGFYLRKHLMIEAKGESDYFVIKFSSQDAAKAARIVSEVAKSYLGLQESHELQVQDKVIEILKELERSQETQVRGIKGRLDERTKLVGGKEQRSAKQAGGKSEAPTISQEVERKLLAAQLEHLTLQAQVNAEKELSQQESFVPPQELVAPQVESHPSVVGLQASLAADREKAAQHKARSANLSQNALYQQLEKKIRDNEAALKTLIADLTTQIAADMEKNARLKRKLEIDELESQLALKAATVTFLSGQLKTEEREQIQLAGDALELDLEWREYDRATKLLERISDQIVSMQVERQSPARVTMFRDATVPVRPDEEIPYKKMLLAALAALAIPFGLAVGVEILFARVSSRQQLESGGKIAVVGEITALPRRIKSRQPQAAPRRDVQLYEESINGLRTYLTLIESARGRRVLAVTSSVSREGKTSLAAQLAVSVASSSGKPTLLIDGDMRSPDLHRIFDVECGPGLAEVLAGECPVEEAIETSFSSQLHVLTAGRLSVSPHQLTGAGEFGSLIEKLRGKYEHIIIDTPPILPASEALLMACAADASILCVRRDYSRVDQVSEAHARLVAAGVKIAGAVLNGVPTQHYAFRYGSYYYTKSRPSDSSIAPADTSTVA